jgi:hypothetical protein
MMNSQQDSEMKDVACDYLLEPDDLKEIMDDLRGEDLTLEELALTLLSGGIELEYLSERYKTSEGDLNLLMVIACQDSLEVDWDDLAARCREVVIAVVANHLRLSDSETDQVRPQNEENLTYLVREGLKVEYEDTSLDPMGYAMYIAKLKSVERLLAETTRVRLTKGGIAPKWSDPHRGAALHRHDPGETPGHDLGNRPSSDPTDIPKLQKGVLDLFPNPDNPGKRGFGAVPPWKVGRLIKEDPSKWKYFSEWSSKQLESIIQQASQASCTPQASNVSKGK